MLDAVSLSPLERQAVAERSKQSVSVGKSESCELSGTKRPLIRKAGAVCASAS